MDLVQREISKETVTPYFIEYFGQAPTHVAAAPGRVNLIGEHTDYTYLECSADGKTKFTLANCLNPRNR